MKIVSGRANCVQGPVQDVVTDPEYLDVTLPANASFRHSVKRGRTAFAYVIEGSGLFDPERDPYARDAVGRGNFEMERN